MDMFSGYRNEKHHLYLSIKWAGSWVIGLKIYERFICLFDSTGRENSQVVL
jgi:hypothetical protein